ncbi:NADP oxidoreductase [Kribbella antibiotica]|uniref:NADP oxidoreductase n=1 Tax=Kribbella antibiotica TaxID=190195 RepID=A0A4V2YPX1_9ACTN|nr:NAD(P)-binding domain-containing protein [Kribbella antibiotica]TDD59857.1 NADP oxidoreductase [Kribbella antibiotica]
MRIGTVGNGGMAEALGRHWVRAGHEVMIGGRDPERAAATAARIGAHAGSLREATSYGEVVLLAVPAEVVVETVAGLEVAAGKVLIDCTNAIDHRDFTLARTATAEAVSGVAPHAQVVKGFNLAPDTVWRDGAKGLGVPLCGESAAVERVAELVRDVGGVPVAAGGLVRARLLEATAAFAIGIWASGGDVRGLFAPLSAAIGTAAPSA